jgi:hypothetical protein
MVIWWANNWATKLDKIEAHMKEAAGMLYCNRASIVEVLKEKIATCNRVEDLKIHREKDLKRIEELQAANIRLRTEKGLLNKQLEHEKKKDW